MLHELLRIWFHWVQAWGYWGVFILMAMESSIIPVPSEIVVPPAAFWAAQGQLNFYGVILAGTLGSYAGSIISYGISRIIGLPLLRHYGRHYGKFFFMTEEHLQLGEVWVKRFGVPGIFFARLLPVIRHLISIPAGVFRMPVGRFSCATLLGAGLWCAVLAGFGQTVIGAHPEVLASPEALILLLKSQLHGFLAAVLFLGTFYVGVHSFKRKVIHGKRTC